MRFIDAWTRILFGTEKKKPKKEDEMVPKGYCQLLNRYVEKCLLGIGPLRGIHFCGYRGTSGCPFPVEQGEEKP